MGGCVKFACPCVWSHHLYVQNSAASAQWCTFVLLAGKVNVTVSSVAEDSHNLCDNRVAVTPLQGKMDTVIKPLLVKVSQTTDGEYLGTVYYPMKLLARGSLDLSWKQTGLQRHGDFLSCLLFLNYSFSTCSQEAYYKRRPKTPFSVLQVWNIIHWQLSGWKGWSYWRYPEVGGICPRTSTCGTIHA